MHVVRNNKGQFVKGVRSHLYKQVELVCEHCGCTYTRKPSRVKKSRFCSRKCCGHWVYEFKNKDKFLEQSKLSGSMSPTWKGGVQVIGGYRLVSRGGKRKQEHRLVMEENIGRELSREEIVHHINGDKLDNRIKNLEILTQSEHIKKHIRNNELGGRVSYEKGKMRINCRVCNKGVVPNSPNQKYCKVCRKKIKYVYQ